MRLLSVPTPSFGGMRRTGTVSVAVVVPTPELLGQMLRERPACWTWAAFASVLFQRWAALEQRKVDQVLASPATPTGRLDNGTEVAEFVRGRLRAVDELVAEVGVFLKSPAFAAVFGAGGAEKAADAHGIVRAGNHLADYYERLLELAEDCRMHAVPEQYTDLVGDCTRFVNQHLQDFARFVDDVLERLEELQKRVMLGERRIRFETLPLRIVTDHRLVWSILDRLQTIE
ncbi:Uncharacterised protein [Mycolicibacterium aurum]|uniref:Uncharacterized protein n=2 Tax=Mycolicibacterium aurum TaxID=1791 RepID=A0A448IYX9_MYCAU|nr:Uncharacterised protein [Mycolicibacterium aurum]